MVDKQNTIFVINSVDYGSTGTLAYSIFKAQKERGLKAFFVVGDFPEKHQDEVSYCVQSSMPKLYFSLYNRFLFGKKGNGFVYKAATKKFLKFVKKNFTPGKTIFSIHNFHGSRLDLTEIVKFCRENDVKITFTLHDCWLLTGGCAHYEYPPCDKWQSSCFDCPIPTTYPLHKGSDPKKLHVKKNTALKSLDKNRVIYIADCDWVKNEYLKSNIKDYEVITIYCGVQELEVSKDIKREKGLLFSAAMPWTERKGINDINELRKLLPINYRMVVAGLTDNDKTVIGIERLPRIDRSQMFEMYSKAEFFINPTHEDTFPLVNPEAEICGASVITYDIGGTKEAIKDSFGAAVPVKDVNAIVEAIHHLEKIDIEKRSNEARNNSKQFTISYMVEQYSKLFDEFFKRD